MKHLLMCLIWLALSEPSCAKAITDYLPEDSIHVMTTEESDTLHTSEKKKSLITRFLDYFNDANKNKKHKKFDFSIIGGPHYSTDTKLGLGLVAAGLYRTNPNDTILPPSNVSLFSDVSTVGFYMLGIGGTHIFPQDKYRADYTVYFYSFPCDYWGMGYDMGNDDSNKSEMKRWQARIKGSFLFHLGSNFYIGPMVSYDYVIGKNVERPELLNGMDRHTWNLGAGFSTVYDSRDVLTYPHQGLYINDPMFPTTLHGQRLCFQYHRTASRCLPESMEGRHPGRGFPYNAQFRQPVLGHDGSLGQQQLHARILRRTI